MLFFKYQFNKEDVKIAIKKPLAMSRGLRLLVSTTNTNLRDIMLVG